MDVIDCLIVGGGVIGLAAASELAGAGYTAVVVDRHARPGMETSTHNSGVIHAGLYYPAGSLKAELCVEGAARLYDWCRQSGVAAERCGKLVLATREEERAPLELLYRRGTENGVSGLEIVDAPFIAAREPHVRAVAALWSPNSGRIDASALVRMLLRGAQKLGAVFLPNSPVLAGEPRPGHLAVRLQRETLHAHTVVNAAGLYADEVSAALGGERFRVYPCRGEYAELKPSRRGWVNGLVYPLPHPSGHGLGVHLTKTTDGNVLLGPTIRFQARKDDYESDRLPLAAFVEGTADFFPALSLADVVYGGSGIRAKLHPPEESFADFLIRHDAQQPRIIHAAGIDSPGLTACLAIAARVRTLVQALVD